MADTQTTTLSRQWLFKTGAFTLVLFGFGVWALVDATILYPRRGRMDASFRLKQWLEAADRSGQLNTPAFTITDPRAELARLQPREAELRSAAAADGSSGRAAATDVARLEWLQSLSRVWSLDASPKYLGHGAATRSLWFEPASGQGRAGPERTPVPLSDLRAELVTLWNRSAKPTPLSTYDLPVQWIFTVAGFGGGAWLLMTMLRARATSRRITWHADAQRLSLPDGTSLTPADLTEVDKRLWHKYYVTLGTRDGGKHRLDLLRFTPLEEWVLAMERTAFPDSAPREASSDEAPEPASAEPDKPAE